MADLSSSIDLPQPGTAVDEIHLSKPVHEDTRSRVPESHRGKQARHYNTDNDLRRSSTEVLHFFLLAESFVAFLFYSSSFATPWDKLAPCREKRGRIHVRVYRVRW